MYDNEVIRRIQRLLESRSHNGNRLSQRAIAKLCGTTHELVGRVKSGERTERPPRSPSEHDADAPSGPAVRCVGCGKRVQLPCQVCAAEKQLELSESMGSRNEVEQPVDGPLGLEFATPHQRQQYEALRLRKGLPPVRPDPSVNDDQTDGLWVEPADQWDEEPSSFLPSSVLETNMGERKNQEQRVYGKSA